MINWKPGMMVKVNEVTFHLLAAAPFSAKVLSVHGSDLKLEAPGLGFIHESMFSDTLINTTSDLWSKGYLLPAAPALAPVILTFEAEATDHA